MNAVFALQYHVKTFSLHSNDKWVLSISLLCWSVVLIPSMDMYRSVMDSFVSSEIENACTVRITCLRTVCMLLLIQKYIFSTVYLICLYNHIDQHRIFLHIRQNYTKVQRNQTFDSNLLIFRNCTITFSTSVKECSLP